MCAQNLCRNCAHKNVQKMRTHKMCRIVHTQICAEMCTPSFVQKLCAEFVSELCAELCPRIVSTKSFRWCTSESFMCVNIVRHVCRKFSPCVRADLCKLYMSRIVRRLSHVQNVKNGPKMTKNDQNRQFGQNVPKWPKMAQNGRKCPGWVHDWSPAPCD